MTHQRLPRFMVICDFEYCRAESRWRTILDQIGSSDWDQQIAVQVRIKNQTQASFTRLATIARDALGDSVVTVLNGDPIVARNLNYHGVHFTTFSRANQSPQNFSWISYAAHSSDECSAIDAINFTCTLLSPIFKPRWKNATPIGIDYLKKFCTLSSLPVFALGGISVENIQSCIDNGAYGIASLSSILDSSTPCSIIERFLVKIFNI